jgi:hypothetical protein
MLNVTRAHFYSTFFVGLVIFFFFRGAYSFSGNASAHFRFEQYIIWHEAWGNMWKAIFCLLQPQSMLLSELGKKGIDSVLAGWSIIILFFLSIPLWSFCFGWLFVKLDNWLNHFPVLGKKVF